MVRRGAIAAVVIVIVAVACPAVSASNGVTAAGRTCASVGAHDVTVVRGRASCRTAQAVLGRFLSGRGTPGWACRKAGRSAGCTKARESVLATPTPPVQPVSKARYEATLGPVLNDDVVPALRDVLAHGGINRPSRVTLAIRGLRLGRDAMSAVNPPLAVADLHREAVATLSFMVADAVAVRHAEIRHDARRKAAAARALSADALQIRAIGNRMTARGF